MNAEVVGFENLQTEYPIDPNFGLIWNKCMNRDATPLFHFHQGYLFRGNQLCILAHFLRELLISEIHSSGLVAHVGQTKTLAILDEQFFLLGMKK